MAGRGSPDDLEFRGSSDATVGIELELAIIDLDTGDLSPGAPRLLSACAEEGLDLVSAELMQSMLEIRTPVFMAATPALADLRRRVGRANLLAKSLGYGLAMWGTHPFARATSHSITSDDRFEHVQRRLDWMTTQRVMFGQHVHVGVGSGQEAVGTINMLVQYLPHLLALSANSPFWQGIDTGLASARAVLYGLVAHAGVPTYFETWKEMCEYLQTMRDGGVLASHKDLKWDIRPRPDLGTIEFRVCDTPPRLAIAGGIAALTRALVASTGRLMVDHPKASRGDVRRQWYCAENKWLAARHGPGATYIRSGGGKRRSLRQELLDLIDRMDPVADEVGDGGLVRGVRTIVRGETGAARQRRIFRETGQWRALVADALDGLAAEVGPACGTRVDPAA
jgi:carboxylate-amine ligase